MAEKHIIKSETARHRNIEVTPSERGPMAINVLILMMLVTKPTEGSTVKIIPSTSREMKDCSLVMRPCNRSERSSGVIVN